ncbi:CoA transferase [Jatrophihabitans sp. DSM 45814]
MTATDLGVRTLPLEDVRAVVLGRSVVSGLIAVLLRQQGGTVTCLAVSSVLPGPTGVDWDELDLDDPAAVAQARATIQAADVVFDSTPEAMQAVALRADALLAAVPQLVHIRVTPFPTAADSEHVECRDWVVAAELGLYQVGNATEPSIELLPVASSYAAVQAATYACAAIPLARESGIGGRVDVSLFGAATLAIDSELQSLSDGFSDARATYHADVNNDHGFGLSARFRCADGRYLQPHGRSPRVTSATIRALGHPEWADEAVDSIMGTGTVSKAEWAARFTEAFAAQPGLELEAAIAAEGGAGAICRSRDEWRAEQHARDTEIFVPAATGAGGPSLMVGPAVRVFAGPLAGPEDVAPHQPLGWRSRGAGVDPGAGPLAGLRVLDLAIVLAGPTCGRILSELGADVIKIDAPERAIYPYRSPYGWLDVNRGKRSILLDLKSAEGKAVMWKLIGEADLILENYRAGKIEQLGFGFGDVARVRPGITYVSLNAFDFGGDFTPRPAWEPNAQAMCGMQVAAANGGKPVRLSLAPNDYGTGQLGAFGAVMALANARRTGRAQHVRGSLARTATFLQREYFDASLDGQAAQKAGPQLHFIECVDGWVVREAGSGDPAADRCDRTVTEVIEALSRDGIVAARVRTTHQVRDLKWVRQAGLVKSWEHPHWGRLTSAVARGTSSLFVHGARWPAPDPGENGRAILADIGYPPDEADRLVAVGAVAERVPLFDNQ